MLRATKDITLPTTITGSLPRPSWYIENLGTRSLMDAMVTNRFREQYVDTVLNGKLFDPVLSIHMKDGWTVVKPIHGYLQHDDDSAGWAEVIQWVNPDCPPPPEFDLQTLARNSPSSNGSPR